MVREYSEKAEGKNLDRMPETMRAAAVGMMIFDIGVYLLQFLQVCYFKRGWSCMVWVFRLRIVNANSYVITVREHGCSWRTRTLLEQVTMITRCM